MSGELGRCMGDHGVILAIGRGESAQAVDVATASGGFSRLRLVPTRLVAPWHLGQRCTPERPHRLGEFAQLVDREAFNDRAPGAKARNTQDAITRAGRAGLAPIALEAVAERWHPAGSLLARGGGMRPNRAPPLSATY